MALNLTLPQSVPATADNLTTIAPDALVAWVAKLGLTDPLRAGRATAEQLTALNAQRVRITLRQDINEAFFPVVQRLLALLERHVQGGMLPLPPEARAAATIADDLIRELAASYKMLLVEQGRRLFGFASSGRALLPIQRAILLAGQRLVLTYRIYATAPKGLWTELHDIYQFAARRGLSQRELAPGESSPAELYKSALMVAFVDPLRLAPGDLDLVLAVINRHGQRAQLGVANDRRASQGAFLVKPQRDVAGYSVTKRQQPAPQNVAPTATSSHDLVLNTLPVAEALLADLTQVSADGMLDAIGLPPNTDSLRAKELLGRLVKMWGASPNRRFNRLRTQARVEVSVGVADIAAFLLDENAPSTGSEWMVTNESEQGFAIIHVSGPIASVRVGEVVGLRTRDSRACHICVVRWVLSDRPEHLEIGLEELARNARAARVRQVRDASGQSVPALLLPESPERGKGQSIIAPHAALDATCELSIGELAATLRMKPTQTVERTSSVQMLEFASVN